MAYLTQLQSISSSITSSGGSLLVVTSEPEKHLEATRKSSGFQGRVLVDTENELAGYLTKEGLVDIAISEKGGYVKGMAQPAVLVLRGGKNGSGEKAEVLERWAIVPSLVSFYFGCYL
jgi:hypothetical protein